MSVENHISALQRKHAEMEKALRAAELSPGTNDFDLQRLKRDKLAIKDEIARLLA
ncbi:YdcH family protein [Paracoccus litorisediminis]|uniref:YdcH family protein n=1 Tax=Paracoccus litorisediminis TaxID=2006130 RepID=UPI00372E97C6